MIKPTFLLRGILGGVLLLAVVATTGCGGAEQRKARFIAKGDALMAERKYDKALLEFRNAVQLDPEDGAARVRVGEAAEKLGNFPEAMQMYQSTLAVDGTNALARARIGRIFVLAGAPDRALEAIDPALKAAPDDPGLLTIRATARMQQGDLVSARADAERAVGVDPGNQDAVAVLAGLMRRAGQADDALALVQKTVGSQPQSVDLRLVLAQLQLDRKDMAGAGEQLREIIRLEPEQLAHRYRLVQLLLASKDTDGAEAVLRQAVKDTPDSTEVKLALAGFLATQRSPAAADRYLATLGNDHANDLELQLGIGDYYATAGRRKEAEFAYRKVIDHDGDGPRGLRAKDRVAALKLRAGERDAAAALVREVLQANPNDADALAIRADLALASGDPAAAVADLRAILRDQPNAVPVRRALARAYLQAGDPTLAEEALRAAIQSNPKDRAVRLDLAELLVRQGKPQAALPVVEKLVADDPNNVSALLALYQVQANIGAFDEALLTAGKMKTLDPNGSLGYYVTGLVEQAKRRPADAARSFAQASERAPGDFRPYQGLASAELAQGRRDAAIAILERGATATGGAPQIVTDLATLLEQAGRPDAAITRYETLLAGDPRNDVAANNLAMLLVTYRKDAGSLARATALAARFKDSTNPALLDTYGWVLHANGHHDDAVAVLQKAVDQAPNVPILQYHLGMAQFEAGQQEEARASLQAALTGQPQYNGVQEARAALAGLGAPASP